MVSGRIAEIIHDDKSSRPVMLEFENGKIDVSQKNYTCGLLKNPKGNLIPALASDKLIYTSKIDRNEEFQEQFLLIRNSKTHKVRLIALDSAMMTAATFKTGDVELSETAPVNVSVRDLQRKFGSKKVQRYTEQQEKLKANVGAMQEQLEKTVADIAITDSEPAAKDVAPDYLPPINVDAKEVSKVYVLKEMVPKPVLKSLTEKAEELLENDESELLSVPFVQTQLQNLKLSNVHNKVESAKVLLIMDVLMKMNGELAKNITNRSYSPCSYSPLLSGYVLDNFTIKTDKVRSRPVSMKQKTACHVLVLGLLAMGNTVNLLEYGVALKMSVKKLQEISRVLRLTFEKKDTKTVSISLPLPAVYKVSALKKKAKFK